MNGKEFIASGGYGAALQYAFHAWQEGKAASECYNPTQAGTHLDAMGQQAPYHAKSSTSALYTMAKSGLSVRTESRPAMYMTRADPAPGWDGCHGVDFQPDRVPFSQGLSPYWLKTSVDLQPDGGVLGLSNVIRLKASLASDDDTHDHFNGVLVAAPRGSRTIGPLRRSAVLLAGAAAPARSTRGLRSGPLRQPAALGEERAERVGVR